MTSTLGPNSILDSAALQLAPLPLDETDVVSGSPRASFIEVLDTPALTVGVWELTEGAVTDTEEDEVFVILSGRATLEFDGREGALHLYPGVIGRLEAGSRTRWTVTETLRKVYVSTPGSEGEGSK
jgi:uncharacterized cupin superfamily protein